jgi:hypothetical protein
LHAGKLGSGNKAVAQWVSGVGLLVMSIAWLVIFNGDLA